MRFLPRAGERRRIQGIAGIETCAGCHAEKIGTSKAEATLVDTYIKPSRETPWLVYSRQPANVWFSHAIHTRRAGLACTDCHGTFGESDQPKIYEQNRISGYSRDVIGPFHLSPRARPARRHEDERLRRLPPPPQRRGGLPRLSSVKEQR